jgi:hypothetical protein
MMKKLTPFLFPEKDMKGREKKLSSTSSEYEGYNQCSTARHTHLHAYNFYL